MIKPITGETALRQLKVILKSAGLPNIRFHDLRHTFATHAVSAGIAPKTLSSILGHSKASFSLDRYINSSPVKTPFLSLPLLRSVFYNSIPSPNILLIKNLSTSAFKYIICSGLLQILNAFFMKNRRKSAKDSRRISVLCNFNRICFYGLSAISVK